MAFETEEFSGCRRAEVRFNLVGGAAVTAIVRLVGILLALVVVINGGYWEFLGHVWAGVSLALLGIVSLMVMTGAKAGHVQESEDAGLD